MRTRRDFLVTSAVSLAAVAARPLAALAAADPSRIALVIGNNKYAQVPLGNAANDARAMADLLASAGFTVDAQIDASGEAFRKSVRAFGEAAARPEVKLAFFYYAGHGVQVEWRNYLLPVDASIGNAEELKRQSLDLGILLSALAKAQGKDLVIVLDACRDNPLGPDWRPDQKGLSQFDAPPGSLIAFSTSPGNTASDGGGQHGLYTENLVRELAVKGAKIEDALKRVRVNVRLASQGAQVPWESTSLEDDVFIFPAQSEPSPQDTEKKFEEELARWNALKPSKNAQEWAAFVRDYPDGQFSEIAQAHLTNMLATRNRVAVSMRGPRSVLQIDADHPVPGELRKSANPFSAGTYPLDRHYTVGDEATYREMDPNTGAVKRKFTSRVTNVDDDNDRVEFNGGNVVTDLLGNPVRTQQVEYDAPVQMNPAELQVGKRWRARYHASRKTGEADIEMKFEVVAREHVVVPAGEFDAFRIEGHGGPVHAEPRAQGFAKGRGRAMAERRAALGGGLRITIWDVPGLNFVVKRVTMRAHGANAGGEQIELVSLRQSGATRGLGRRPA